MVLLLQRCTIWVKFIEGKVDNFSTNLRSVWLMPMTLKSTKVFFKIGNIWSMISQKRLKTSYFNKFGDAFCIFDYYSAQFGQNLSREKLKIFPSILEVSDWCQGLYKVQKCCPKLLIYDEWYLKKNSKPPILTNWGMRFKPMISTLHNLSKIYRGQNWKFSHQS